MVKLVTTFNLEMSILSINFVAWHHLFRTMTLVELIRNTLKNVKGNEKILNNTQKMNIVVL